MRRNLVKRREGKTINTILKYGLSVCTVDSKYKNHWLFKPFLHFCIYKIIKNII